MELIYYPRCYYQYLPENTTPVAVSGKPTVPQEIPASAILTSVVSFQQVGVKATDQRRKEGGPTLRR